MQTLWITHYFLRRPNTAGWIEVPFIAKAFSPGSQNDGHSYYGFELDQPLSLDFIQQLLQSHEIRPADYLYQIYPAQRLWLSPHGEIWLASTDDPLGDPRKILVDKLQSGYIPAVTWDQAAKSDTLAESIVVRSSITNHSVEAYPGDYLLSPDYLSDTRDIKHQEAYYPYWQRHLSSRVLQDTREVANAIHSRSPDLNTLPYQEHDYRNVEETIVGRRLALPYEVIFQTTRRMRSLEILPFGNIQYFALVYLRGSIIESDLELRSEERFKGYYREFIERIEKLAAKVCAPTHTAVDDLLTDAITERALTRTLKDDENKVSKLARWIAQNPDGVVACDTGIAFQLMAMGRKQEVKQLAFSRIRYEEPIPCGMAYVKEDQVWGNYLRKAISDEFRSSDGRVLESLADFRKRFEQIDGIWAPCIEVRVQ